MQIDDNSTRLVIRAGDTVNKHIAPYDDPKDAKKALVALIHFSNLVISALEEQESLEK